MKYVFFLFLFLSAGLQANSRTTLDSLRKELAKGENVSLLLKLSEYQKQTDKNEALNYAFRAKDLATETGDNEGVNAALVVIAVCYFEMDSLTQSIAFWKKSIDFAQKTANDKRLIESKKALADISFRENNYRQALKAYLDILAMKELNDFPEKKAVLKMELGACYLRLGNYEAALENLFQAKNELNDTSMYYGKTLNRIAVVYYQKGDYEKSIEYLIETAGVYEKTGFQMGIATVNNNIGAIYYKLNNLDKALEYYEYAKKKYLSVKNYKRSLSVTNNIARLYREKGDLHKAKQYFLDIIKISDSIRDERQLAITLNNLGLIYSETGQPDSALMAANKALAYYKERGSVEGQMNVYRTFAEIYKRTGDFTKEEDYLNKALELALALQMKDQIKIIYSDLAEVNYKLGKFRKAYQNQKLFNIYKDSVFNENSSKRMAELQTKYETAKKEKENLKLRSKNELQKLIIEKKNTIIWAFSIGGSMVMLLLVLLFLEYRKKNKAYQVLVRQNKDIARKELLDKEEEVAAGDEQSKDLIDRFDRYIEEEKPYLQSDFSMDDLCRILQTNRSYMSKAINTSKGKSFPDFLNELRVQEARRLLVDEKYKHITMEGIAHMSGFASRSSFYNNFKKCLGITPSYFRKSAQT